MAIKYLYIPISSMSFNNILISENIIPPILYENKGFGVQRFKKNILNNLDYAITAYSKIIPLEIHNKNYEEHLIYIAIKYEEFIRQKLNFKKIEDSNISTFYIYDCVDLSEVYYGFLTSDNLLNSKIGAESSIELKGLNFKASCFQTLNKTQNGNKWISYEEHQKLSQSNNTPVNPDHKHSDSILDSLRHNERIKGAIWAYNLGIKLNPTPIDSLFYHGKFPHFIDDNNLNWNGDTQKIEFRNGSNNDKLFDVISLTIDTIMRSCLSFNNDDFNLSKADLLYKIGTKLKDEYYKDKWEDSSQRIYFNNLMGHIETYKPFDLRQNEGQAEGDFWKSLAAVITGDRDLDDLKKHLIELNVENIQIAFIIWGAIFGYTNIPKTMFDEFFDRKPIRNLTYSKSLGKSKTVLSPLDQKIYNFLKDKNIKKERAAVILKTFKSPSISTITELEVSLQSSTIIEVQKLKRTKYVILSDNSFNNLD